MKKLRCQFLVSSCLFFLLLLPLLPQSEETGSCEALYREHPDRVRRFFEALDLERGELVNVKSAVHKKAWPAACETLVAYYREGNLSVWLRNQPVEIENER